MGDTWGGEWEMAWTWEATAAVVKSGGWPFKYLAHGYCLSKVQSLLVRDTGSAVVHRHHGYNDTAQEDKSSR